MKDVHRPPPPSQYAGGVDCDLHPAVPDMSVLLPYLDDYWREMVEVRALDRLNLSLTSYPVSVSLSRPCGDHGAWWMSCGCPTT